MGREGVRPDLKYMLHTHGPRIYFDTGDLSTLEYLYDLRCISASSEMHSAAAFSRAQHGQLQAKLRCGLRRSYPPKQAK